MIRVVSWNIELGRNIEQAAKEVNGSDRLRSPDVLLVQEMSPAAVAELAERLGMDFRYAAPANHPHTGAPFGNAVLSPWPMSEVAETPLPHTSVVMGQKRAATSTVVDIAGIEVEAHSVHLETVLLPIRWRVAQVRSVAGATTSRDRPCLVGGDFNAASARSLRNFDGPLHDVGFDRITSNVTKSFRRFGRDFALDHVYVRDMAIHAVGVETTASASDHLPVWAVLEVLA